MELYKFINKDTIIRAKNPLWIKNSVISNPTEETLRALGYTDLIAASVMPEVAENEVVIPQYAVNEDGMIIQTYRTEVLENEFV